MLAFERESGPFIVIEQRGFPLDGVMTIRARRYLVGLCELFPVRILVAVLALGGCLFEVGIDELGLKVGRLVAVNARHRSVRALQRERRLVVIKAVEFSP